MIKHLKLENYRSHAEFSGDFGPMTLVTGPNGSGKSTVLDAVHMVSQLWYKPHAQAFSGMRGLDMVCRRGPSGFVRMAIAVSGNQNGFSRSVSIEARSERDREWTVDVSANGNSVDTAKSIQESDTPNWPSLNRSVLFHVDPDRVPAFSDADKHARIRHDGLGVATVVANLQLTEEERFSWIQDDLHEVFPWINRVRAVPSNGQNGISGFHLVFDTKNGSAVPGFAVGSGALVTLALLVSLHMPVRPRLALVDDIDKHLDADAFSVLVDILNEDLNEHKDDRYALQVIATCRSPQADVPCINLRGP